MNPKRDRKKQFDPVVTLSVQARARAPPPADDHRRARHPAALFAPDIEENGLILPRCASVEMPNLESQNVDRHGIPVVRIVGFRLEEGGHLLSVSVFGLPARDVLKVALVERLADDGDGAVGRDVQWKSFGRTGRARDSGG
jgi:hypothetical protein